LSRLARIGWIVASALLILVVWLALGEGSVNAGVGFLYAIPVGLAVWWFGRPAVPLAVAGALCLVLLGSLANEIPHLGLSLAVRFAAYAAVALVTLLVRERIEELEHSAEELAAIRAALAPPSLPELPGIEAAAAFVPSELGVSGDFYLLTNGPDDSTVAVVGDVVGHGPKAARLATFVRAQLAAFAANSGDPAEILALANAALADQPRRRRDLISAVCMAYRPSDGRLSWAVAGHPPPLRLPGCERLDRHGDTQLLGVEDELTLSTAECELGADSGVLVYTDGATDVRRGRSLLGTDGLLELTGPIAHLPVKDLVRRLQQSIVAWTDAPVRDDMCIVALRPRRT
jgi:serine phosphatase RsbU (regulator of sigma subunit)